VSVATGTRVGEAWVQAIVAGDEAALLAVLDPSVDFGALTPGAAWSGSTAAEVAAVVLGRWFASPRQIEAIEEVEHGTAGDRERVGYRFLASTPDGERTIEQQAYFDVDDDGDRIVWLRILCSGFRPLSTGASDGR
jgi:hypothetical protein